MNEDVSRLARLIQLGAVRTLVTAVTGQILGLSLEP